MKAHETFIELNELIDVLDQLAQAVCANDVTKVRAILQTTVSGYQPDSQVADWVYRKTNDRK